MPFSNMAEYFTAKCEHLQLIIADSLQLKNSKVSLVSLTVYRWFGDNDVTCKFLLSALFSVLSVHVILKLSWLWYLSSPWRPWGHRTWLLCGFSQCSCPHGLHGDRKNWREGMNPHSYFLYSAVLVIHGLNYIITTVYPTLTHSLWISWKNASSTLCFVCQFHALWKVYKNIFNFYFINLLLINFERVPAWVGAG